MSSVIFQSELVGDTKHGFTASDIPPPRPHTQRNAFDNNVQKDTAVYQNHFSPPPFQLL